MSKDQSCHYSMEKYDCVMLANPISSQTCQNACVKVLILPVSNSSYTIIRFSWLQEGLTEPHAIAYVVFLWTSQSWDGRYLDI